MPRRQSLARADYVESLMDDDATLLNGLRENRLRGNRKIYPSKLATSRQMETLVKSSSAYETHPIHDGTWFDIHEEDMAEGAEYCIQYEEQLARLEPISEEFSTYLTGKFNMFQARHVVQAFEKRCITGLNEYVNLLIQISVECASRQMNKNLKVCKNHKMYLAPADIYIKPWDTSVVIDVEDGGKPLLTIKHCKVSFDDDYPMPEEVDPAVRMEMACQMNKHSLTHYQGFCIDGAMANIRLVKVPDVEFIFRNHKSDIGDACYRLPSERNGLVCHLVNLFKNSDDFEKYFKYMSPYTDLLESDEESDEVSSS